MMRVQSGFYQDSPKTVAVRSPKLLQAWSNAHIGRPSAAGSRGLGGPTPRSSLARHALEPWNDRVAVLQMTGEAESPKG